jgi:hypothetical protein
MYPPSVSLPSSLDWRATVADRHAGHNHGHFGELNFSSLQQAEAIQTLHQGVGEHEVEFLSSLHPYAEKSVSPRAREGRAYDYLLYPFQREELLDMVRRALEDAHIRVPACCDGASMRDTATP